MFKMKIHRLSGDFAIIVYGVNVFQLHADGTYSNNPLLSLLPENPPRSAGVELRFYETDPDIATDQALAKGFHVLQKPIDKPHGLREAYILDPDGYVWIPPRPI